MHQILSWLALAFGLVAAILWIRGTIQAFRDPERFCIERQPWVSQSLMAGGLALGCWLLVNYWVPEREGPLQANAAVERRLMDSAMDRRRLQSEAESHYQIFSSGKPTGEAPTAEGMMADPR